MVLADRRSTISLEMPEIMPALSLLPRDTEGVWEPPGCTWSLHWGLRVPQARCGTLNVSLPVAGSQIPPRYWP